MKQSVVDPPSWTENASSSTHSLLISFGHLVSQQSLRTGIWLKPQKIIRTSWGQKKGVLASSALDHNRRTAVGAKSWAVAAKTWLWSVMISYDKKRPRNLAEPLMARNSTTKTWTLIETVFRLPTKNAKPAVFKNPRSPGSCGISSDLPRKKKTSTKLWPPEHGWCLTCPNKMRRMAASKLWIPQEMHASKLYSLTNVANKAP